MSDARQREWRFYLDDMIDSPSWRQRSSPL